MNGIKSIGFNLKDGSDYEGMFNLYVGRTLQKENKITAHKGGNEFMKTVKFEENELMVMAIFAEKIRQDTVMTLKETLELLEETKEDVSDEEMIEIVYSLIEKLQQTEDKYFYALDLDSYLIAGRQRGMYMTINQFALYRVNKMTAGWKLWHLSYNEAREKKLSIRMEFYRQIVIGEMQKEETANDVWKRIRNKAEVSDVSVFNHEREISCFYLSDDHPRRISGFIRMNSTGSIISMDTMNYKIDGYFRNWKVADNVIIDGKQFYLMEHQEFREQAARIILDSYGKFVAETGARGFDETAKKKIREYNHPQEHSSERMKQLQIKLEIYQKYFQNGMYERSHESGTEANYDMIDGQVNNQKKAEEKIQNPVDKRPKKRTSVIKKLHEEQIAIAKRSGKPVPRYLEQQMAQERSRK